MSLLGAGIAKESNNNNNNRNSVVDQTGTPLYSPRNPNPNSDPANRKRTQADVIDDDSVGYDQDNAANSKGADSKQDQILSIQKQTETEIKLLNERLAQLTKSLAHNNVPSPVGGAGVVTTHAPRIVPITVFANGASQNGQQPQELHHMQITMPVKMSVPVGVVPFEQYEVLLKQLTQYEALSKLRDQAKETLQQRNSQILTFSNQAAELSTARQDRLSQQARLDTLENEIKKIRLDLSEQGSEFQTKSKEAAQLSADMQLLSNEISQVEMALIFLDKEAPLSAEVAKLKADHQVKTARLAALEKDLAEKNQQIAEIRNLYKMK